MKPFAVRFTKEAAKDVKKLPPRLKRKLREMLWPTWRSTRFRARSWSATCSGFYSVRLTHKDRIVYSVDERRDIVIEPDAFGSPSMLDCERHYGEIRSVSTASCKFAMSERPPADNSLAAEKVRSFPQTPGVYLMKDAAGRVIYVGKAKNLRARAGSYFLKAAAEDPRTAKLVPEIRDIDYLDAESEVDALLMEARLIKDIQPKFNRDLRDDKTFPYLEISTHEDFPRVRFTREPKAAGHEALRAVRQSARRCAGRSRCCRRSSSSAPARWTSTRTTRAGGGSAPACWHSIDQCTAPCNLRISKEEYRKDIHRLQRFLEGGKNALLGEMREEMAAAAKELHFEEAARLRDEIEMLETLDERGELETHVQPEVFPIDPKTGLAGLQKVLHLDEAAADDRGHRHRPPRPARRPWPAVVQFIDGLPFKPGYRRMQDSRRRRASTTSPASTRWSPGGSSTSQRRRRDAARHPADRRRQGAAQRGAWRRSASLEIDAADGDLAGQARGSWSSCPDADEPLRSEPPLLRPAAAAIRPRRGPPLRPALPPHAAAEVAVGRIRERRKAESGGGKVQL